MKHDITFDHWTVLYASGARRIVRLRYGIVIPSARESRDPAYLTAYFL